MIAQNSGSAASYSTQYGDKPVGVKGNNLGNGNFTTDTITPIRKYAKPVCHGVQAENSWVAKFNAETRLLKSKH